MAVLLGATSRNLFAAATAAAKRLGWRSVFEHRLRRVDGDHHGAALLLARSRPSTAAPGPRPAAPRRAAPRTAAAARSRRVRRRGPHAHHGRVGPGRRRRGVGRRSQATRPAARTGTQEEGPQPLGDLEGHDSRGPIRQAATPARTSRAARDAGGPGGHLGAHALGADEGAEALVDRAHRLRVLALVGRAAGDVGDAPSGRPVGRHGLAVGEHAVGGAEGDRVDRHARPSWRRRRPARRSDAHRRRPRRRAPRCARDSSGCPLAAGVLRGADRVERGDGPPRRWRSRRRASGPSMARRRAARSVVGGHEQVAPAPRSSPGPPGTGAAPRRRRSGRRPGRRAGDRARRRRRPSSPTRRRPARSWPRSRGTVARAPRGGRARRRARRGRAGPARAEGGGAARGPGPRRPR